jgi:hydroxymethylbilane synthase
MSMLSIATRGSKLALWQAELVQRELARGSSSIETRLEIVRTTGDRITDVPLSRIGDRGLFTRELDNALIDRKADCAVHSLKDVPTLLPDGLAIAAILPREDPRDAFVARDKSATLHNMPPHARVGTSSLRRRALLLEQRPDLHAVDVRGNLDTRLEKLRAGEYDALILAAAGLIRLGRADAITSLLDGPHWLPAPGQGAIAVVARADDDATLALLRPLHHEQTGIAVRAERALLRALEGGCQVPIGALADVRLSDMTLRAIVAHPDGHIVLRDSIDGGIEPGAAESLGQNLAARLLDAGADAILRDLRAASRDAAPPVTPP